MDRLIIRFASCARAAGLMVSQAEVMDTLAHLALVDVTDPEAFRRVLRTNFAKSRRDQGRFDHLFHLFFHEMREDAGVMNSLLAPEAARLARDLAENLPDLNLGDLVYSENIGAYSHASSTWFNGFPPAKVVHINQ